jgi:nucleoside-diphosphate kinase
MPDEPAEIDSSLGYVLLKPDCLFRGLVGPALRRVEDAGFQIVGYEVLGSLDRETVHTLFGRSFNGTHDVWDINARLFDLGPSVLAIVRHADDGTDAAPLLNRLKGAIMPALSPGSIRSALGVRNRVLNLVHTPNSLEAAVGDLRALIGARSLLELLERSPPDSQDQNHEASSFQLADLVRCHGYGETSTNGLVHVQHLKLRILYRVSRAPFLLARADEARPAVDELHRFYHRQEELVADDSPAGSGSVELAAADSSEERRLADKLLALGVASPRDAECDCAMLDSPWFHSNARLALFALTELAKPERYHDLRFTALWRALEGASVWCSSAERFLIETALRYFPGPLPAHANSAGSC